MRTDGWDIRSKDLLIGDPESSPVISAHPLYQVVERPILVLGGKLEFTLAGRSEKRHNRVRKSKNGGGKGTGIQPSPPKNCAYGTGEAWAETTSFYLKNKIALSTYTRNVHF